MKAVWMLHRRKRAKVSQEELADALTAKAGIKVHPETIRNIEGLIIGIDEETSQMIESELIRLEAKQEEERQCREVTAAA
jgi:hypothetical protein